MSRCTQRKEFPKDVNPYANRYHNIVPLYPSKTVLYSFLLQSRKNFTMLFRPLPQHFNLQESLTKTGFATSFPDYEVTAPQGNSKSDNAQSNESSNPENEWQTVDAKKKKKKNKTRRKKISEAQSNAHDDTENSTPANESTTLLIGDSMIKNIQGTRLGKAVGHRVVVKSFSGATTKAMKDYLKPNLELSPDQVILHVGTNDLKSKEPQQVAGSVVDLARQIENSSDATVIISELVQRRDGFNEAVKTVNKQLKFYCRQNGWKFIQHP